MTKEFKEKFSKFADIARRISDRQVKERLMERRSEVLLQMLATARRVKMSELEGLDEPIIVEFEDEDV